MARARSISAAAAAGLGGQDQVQLAVDVRGTSLAALLVELHVTGLVLERQRVGLGLQDLGGADVVGALVEQQLPLAGQERRPVVLGSVADAVRS